MDSRIRSASKIAEKYNLNRKTIIYYAKLKGIIPNNCCNRTLFNDSVFEEIDTEKKAYWLGFLYADGYLSPTKPKVALLLASKDLDHMLKYAEFLDYPKEIPIRKNGKGKYGDLLWSCSVVVLNPKLWNDLYEKGCVPQKSLILKFPAKDIFKSEDLIRHFIRGYCDGDGSLRSYICKNGRVSKSVSFVGTKDFLFGIATYLNIPYYLAHKKGKSPEVYTLRYSSKNAEEAAKFLYNNSNIYMTRKYNRYLDIVNMFPPSYKTKVINLENSVEE